MAYGEATHTHKSTAVAARTHVANGPPRRAHGAAAAAAARRRREAQRERLERGARQLGVVAVLREHRQQHGQPHRADGRLRRAAAVLQQVAQRRERLAALGGVARLGHALQQRLDLGVGVLGIVAAVAIAVAAAWACWWGK